MLGLTALAAGVLMPLGGLVETAFKLQLLGSYLERLDDVLLTPREQAGLNVRPAQVATSKGLRVGDKVYAVGFNGGRRQSIEPGQTVSQPAAAFEQPAPPLPKVNQPGCQPRPCARWGSCRSISTKRSRR